ncbi:D-aminoacyl-tRNA deacylase [Desulfosarcina sp. BuS5]|uniref:D-aminoacyl-tRNA deacylase n=1 Tax=Desulfosarcina sp. BuS5 TaxID=933262 RepID=UPI000683E9A5|nr:D-aminoacyl-tRNA deacylase [Desulfosarcina sp. BuS5]WDN90654.1 D-aminoacyl-tRNA deacylase [Desulfosarcina sp. BuS5]
MRAVIQRVKESAVKVKGEFVARIGKGLLVLLGVAKSDVESDADYLAEKIVNLRIFEDEKDKMNRSLIETSGSMLVVSQFTLLGDCKKGRRPSFINAAGPERANTLYEYFVEHVSRKGVKVKTGRFGAMMDVHLINDGPVTLTIDSKINAIERGVIYGRKKDPVY